MLDGFDRGEVASLLHLRGFTTRTERMDAWDLLSHMESEYRQMLKGPAKPQPEAPTRIIQEID